MTEFEYIQLSNRLRITEARRILGDVMTGCDGIVDSEGFHRATAILCEY